MPLILLLLGGAGPGARVPELVMLDVGQGDSFLLRDGRAHVLVDGGGCANVYRARDSAGLEVAIKLLLTQTSAAIVQ